MAQSNAVYWDLMLELADGKDAEFQDLMAEMVQSTEKEEGCLDYAWHRSGNAVHIFERYADNAAAGIHLQNFQTHFAKRFFGMLRPTGFHVYGAVSGPVKAGLEQGGATIYEQVGGFSR